MRSRGGISGGRRRELWKIVREARETRSRIDPELLEEALDGYEAVLSAWRDEIPDAIEGGYLEEQLNHYRSYAAVRADLDELHLRQMQQAAQKKADQKK